MAIFRFARPLKWWEWTFLVFAVALISVAYYWPRVGGLLLTIVNAESSIGFWMKRIGLTFWQAEAVATGISTAENILWLVLFSATRNLFVRRIKPIYENIARQLDPATFNGNSEWMKFVYGVGHEVLRFLVPPMPPEDADGTSFARVFPLYFRITLDGFIPTHIFTSVGYSVALAYRGLVDIWVAGLLMCVANCAKMLACGYASLWVPWWVPLVTFWLAPGIAVYVVKRTKKKDEIKAPSVP